MTEPPQPAPAIRIAHLSDVHLGPLGPQPPWHWNTKRALGYLNWLRKRRFIHDPAVARRIVAHAWQQGIDHMLISGDLANVGLPAELGRAAKWLAEVGPPSRVSVVPGNHDIYCTLARDAGVARWQAYMSSDEPESEASPSHGSPSAPAVAATFPFVRHIGDWLSVIGLNSAVPTPPGIAHGALGVDQVRRLQACLAQARRQRRFRLVMLHHPPLPGQVADWRGLQDAAALHDVIRAEGCELLVHGHEHVPSLAFIEREGEPAIPVVGVGSASARRAYHHEPPGSYHLFTLRHGLSGQGDPISRFQVEWAAFGLTADGSEIIEQHAPRMLTGAETPGHVAAQH